MDKQELDLILAKHSKWLSGDSEGVRADLRNANLYNADLRNANLYNADLRNADLRNANLYNADLRNTSLRNANLYNANLYNTNLYNANLYNTNLYNAKNKEWVCDGVFHQVTNIGSERGVLEIYSCGGMGWLVKKGFFIGSKDEFVSKVLIEHEGDEHAKKYLALIEVLCV
jgi:hypothetical protein